MSSKYCPKAHDSIHFTPDGKVTMCCLQAGANFDWPKTSDIDFNDMNAWYKNHPKFKEIREALHRGEKHFTCDVCWDIESKGAYSKRKKEIIFREKRKKPRHRETDGLIHSVDYRISNKCNLQCKMCWPGASDQIDNLAKELDSKNIKHLLFKDPPVTDVGNAITKRLLDYPQLQRIQLAGGEPFVMPEVEELLIKLAEKNHTHIAIRILPNCTTIKTSVLNALEKFNDVEIMCSIDGVKEEIEYQRYPCSWKTIDKNFTRLYNSKIKSVNLTPCISFLNFRTIPEFFEWAEKFPKSHVAFNLIHNKHFLNYKFIPMENRKEMLKKFTGYSFKNNVNTGWRWFKEKGMFEYENPTQSDCDTLYIQSQNVWDYKCKVKFLDAYPWATYMLNRAKVDLNTI